MEFSFVSLIVFVVFILPGFFAQRSKQAIFPRSLRPMGILEEAGSLVFSSVLTHSLLCIFLWIALAATHAIFHSAAYFPASTQEFSALLWKFPLFAFSYLWAALLLGYLLGFVEGWMLLRQPVRTWVLDKGLRPLLERIGVHGLLEERPIWFDVLNCPPSKTAFVEVALKNDAGYYTDELKTYAIVDDTERKKDFCLIEVYFKKQEAEAYSKVPCSYLLLNFEDVYSLRVSIQPSS